MLTTKSKWGVIFAVVLSLVIAGVIFKLNTRVAAYEFQANLLEVRENSVVGEGKFTVSNKDISPLENESYTVEILIGPDTKITREGLLIPRTPEMFKIDDLEKDVKDVDLETLRKDFSEGLPISLYVKAERNVYQSSKFEASEITYRLPIYPQ